MNPKQKKFLVVAGIVLAIVYFAPSYINYQRRLAFVRAQMAAHQAKPSPAQGASPLPVPAGAQTPSTTAPTSTTIADAPPQIDALIGVWQGIAALPNRGMCTLKLELRKNLEQISGFPVLVCMPMTQPAMRPGNPNAFLTQMTPEAAVLSGAFTNGAIDFRVERIIGKGPNGCELTAFTVTPFGTDQIAADWKESNCAGGQILLNRLRVR
jgi:hypothetical protein